MPDASQRRSFSESKPIKHNLIPRFVTAAVQTMLWSKPTSHSAHAMGPLQESLLFGNIF